MVRTLASLPILLLATLLAHPEVSEDKVHQLSANLASDGITGRLAEALKTEAGRRALTERIDLLMAAPLARIRQDAHGLWEEHYFSTDDAGRLILRPERRLEIERLRARRPLSIARFESYGKRLDEIGLRIQEENELDKVAKAGWKERDWRLGLYTAYISGGVPDSDHDLDQVLDTRVLLWLLPGADRKLRVSEPGALPLTQLMTDVYGLLDEVKKYEASYLKLVAKADPQTAKAAAAEEVALLACAKLALDVKSGGADALTRLVDLDPKEAVKDAESTLRAAARLKPRLDEIALALADDDSRSNDLKTFLKDGRARVLLTLRIEPTEATVTARLDRFFSSVLPGAWCDAKGDGLVFKRAFFRDQSGQETVRTFRAYTFDNWSNQLGVMQHLFLSSGERCADPEVAGLLRDVEILPLLRQDVARISEARSVWVQDRSTEMFVKLYFVEKEGKLAVRPDREKAVEAMLGRAEELKPKN